MTRALVFARVRCWKDDSYVYCPCRSVDVHRAVASRPCTAMRFKGVFYHDNTKRDQSSCYVPVPRNCFIAQGQVPHVARSRSQRSNTPNLTIPVHYAIVTCVHVLGINSHVPVIGHDVRETLTYRSIQDQWISGSANFQTVHLQLTACHPSLAGCICQA